MLINLTYSLLSNRTEAIVHLQPRVINYYPHYRPFSINFTLYLTPCPLGFELISVDGQYKCDCDQTLHHCVASKFSIKCDINTQMIHVHKKSLWIGCLNQSLSHNESTCDVLVASSDCDYYCSHQSRGFSIFKLDDQCILGRTGVLNLALCLGYPQGVSCVPTEPC